MRERLITITLLLAALLVGYVVRGKVNDRQLANWVNGSCEVKQRQMARPDPAQIPPGWTMFYIHCE